MHKAIKILSRSFPTSPYDCMHGIQSRFFCCCQFATHVSVHMSCCCLLLLCIEVISKFAACLAVCALFKHLSIVSSRKWIAKWLFLCVRAFMLDFGRENEKFFLLHLFFCLVEWDWIGLNGNWDFKSDWMKRNQGIDGKLISL